MLYTFGYNLARYKRQPADLGYDAAVAAYQRLRTRGLYQYRFQCPFAGYCRRIVVNEFWRRLNEQPPPSETLTEELAPPTESPLPSAERRVMEELQPCIDKLPARDWQILHDLYFKQLTPQTIADQLDIERNYVNQLAFRARHKLRDCLEARGYQSVDDLL